VCSLIKPKLGFMGVPPSKLGFVCKPDMPPHINILFRARPAFEYIKKSKLTPNTPYSGIFDGFRNYIDMFESFDKEKNKPNDASRTKKLFDIVEKSENNKVDNNEKLKECKSYTII